MPQSNGQFSPGFRLSSLDVFVLIGGTIGAAILGLQILWIGLVVSFVVGHFFLFCNVFRMSRPLELAWASVFTLLAGLTILSGYPGWGVTVAISIGATLVLVVIEMRRPSYHGVGWERINPGLRQWWNARTGKS
jgi:hypothetical protein